jgi:uncharacterized protein
MNIVDGSDPHFRSILAQANQAEGKPTKRSQPRYSAHPRSPGFKLACGGGTAATPFKRGHEDWAVKSADVRFYAELNDFLAPWRRGRTSRYDFDVSGSVKDLIEALGVPHTEVDLVLANGESVDFYYRVQNGDRIAVYPQFETLNVSHLIRLRAQPLRHPRFVADTHLGRLAAYLRMMGFDTVYRTDTGDEELARISANEKRILLTRDRGLLKRNIVTRGYSVRTTNPREQLAEVFQRFDLSDSIRPFERCIHCNELLQPAPKELIIERLLPETKKYFDEFWICRGCHRIYWKGSHYRRMRRLIASVVSAGRNVSRP